MSRVLILFGSTDGHTQGIAQAMGDALRRSALDVDIIQAGTLDPSPQHYAGIIVAASLHGGRYQKAVRQWVRAHAIEFGSRPTAFVSVCLAILQQSDAKVMGELDAIVQRFVGDAGWRPVTIKHVAGALLYTRYNFLKRWVMKRIAARAGGATDTSKDYDYTDWVDVRAFAEDFGRRLTRAAA
jgi:menaquinone-dependent protoporphyrinogen oxidase